MAARQNFGKALSNLKSNPGDELRKIEVSTDGFEKIIPYDEMRPSEDNKFPIGSIDDLAESLKTRLLHNLIVIPIEGEDYKYKILAGERRYRAIGKLLEEGNKKYEPGIRCLVIDKNTSVVDQKIIMEESNLKQREYDPKSRREAIERLTELYRLKNDKDGNPESIPKKVAEVSGIGERQIQRYNAVNEKLIPELKEAFDTSKINLEKAAQFATMDRESQMIVVELLKSSSSISKKEIALVKEESEKKEKELLNKIEEMNQKFLTNDENFKLLKNQLDKKEEELSANNEREKKLRKEIEEEQLANNPNSEKFEKLNEELEKVRQENHEMEFEKEDITRQVNQQQKELNSLRKELQKAQKINNENKLLLSEEEKAKLKDSFEISNIIAEVKKELNQLFIKGESFKKKYSELPTEEFYDEIIQRLEEDKKKIMKGDAKKVRQ